MPASLSVPITWSVLSSRGSSTSAVSVFSVLAGRRRACGALAASTSPVSASATTQAGALTAGGAAPSANTVGCLVSRAPPTGPFAGLPSADAVSGPATTRAVAAQAVSRTRIAGTLERPGPIRHTGWTLQALLRRRCTTRTRCWRAGLRMPSPLAVHHHVERVHVLLLQAQDRLGAAEEDDPAVLALDGRDALQRLGHLFTFAAVDHAVRTHRGAPSRWISSPAGRGPCPTGHPVAWVRQPGHPPDDQPHWEGPE